MSAKQQKQLDPTAKLFEPQKIEGIDITSQDENIKNTVKQNNSKAPTTHVQDINNEWTEVKTKNNRLRNEKGNDLKIISNRCNVLGDKTKAMKKNYIPYKMKKTKLKNQNKDNAQRRKGVTMLRD